MPVSIFMKRGTNIMAPEPISEAYFLNSSHPSVSVYGYVTKQRLGKEVTAATITHAPVELLDMYFLCNIRVEAL
jgi:hypothetical protein